MMTRAKILKLMDEYVREHIEDENYFEAWIAVMPDEADDDLITDIAEDKAIFNQITRLFGRLVSQYDLDNR